MVFTNEVNWSAFDFVVASVLFFSFGFILEIILRKTQKQNNESFCALFLFCFFLISIEHSVEFLVSLFAGNQPLIPHNLP